MLKSFWINHQKFLLACAGALLAFLVASSFIGGLAEGAEETYRRCRDLRRDIDSLHKDLKRTYHSQLLRVAAYEEHEDHLLRELGLPLEPDLDASKTPLIELNRRIDEIWAQAQRLASPRGLTLPQKLTAAEFGAEASHSPSDYRFFHSYLGVVGRSLQILVSGGMTRIGRPELIPEVLKEIRVGEEVVGRAYLRGVGFQVEGTYESFVNVLRLAQEPGAVLQVRIAGRLAPIPAEGESDRLSAVLELYGTRVQPVTEDAAGSSPLLQLDEEPVSPGRRR